MADLEGKAALVTGATRGLGRHLAERLCREGCDVIICGRSHANLDDAREGIAAATGVRVPAQVADVTAENQVKALVEEDEPPLYLTVTDDDRYVLEGSGR